MLRLIWYAGSLIAFVTQIALITGLLFHRTGRRRAEVALHASECARRSSDERVHTLAGRLIAAQEKERARIARELHDDLGQKLALLSMELDHLVSQTLGSDGLLRRAQAAAASVTDIATGVHDLSHQLHPARLEMLGLEPALRSLCRDMSSAHNLPIEFDHGPIPGPIPYDTALCLFRVTQEALRNVVKHSASAVARVRLSHADGTIELHIADSGRGFSPRPFNGLGLVSMRERVHFLGGQIAVESMPGSGTRIDVNVPVEWARQNTPVVSRIDDATNTGRRRLAFGLRPGCGAPTTS